MTEGTISKQWDIGEIPSTEPRGERGLFKGAEVDFGVEGGIFTGGGVHWANAWVPCGLVPSCKSLKIRTG